MQKILPVIHTLALLFGTLSAETLSVNPSTSSQFQSFTGKVLGNRVRLRTKADLESPVIDECLKNELLLVVGEDNEFWKVQPPRDLKAYIYKRYVNDGAVDVNRVNIRLTPSLEAPLLGQLQKGDKIIHSKVSSTDSNWLEITLPKNVPLYIAKEFVSYAGSAEYFSQFNAKKTEAAQLLQDANQAAEAECKKPFDQMHPQIAIQKYETLIQNYSDFDEVSKQAKENLALLQKTHLQKKVAFLENREPSAVPSFASVDLSKTKEFKSHMAAWIERERNLFEHWSASHLDQTIDEFYQDQRVNAVIVKGTVQAYPQALKNKPGDFILQGAHAPVGYLYSTKIDLEKHVGKELTLLVAPRSNNHFAFPAYFVLEAN